MVATTIELERKTDAPTSFWAVSGGIQAIGDTPGAALDNLLRQLPHGLGGPLVVLPRNQPDEFFTREQQERLQELMNEKRRRSLTSRESEELAALIDTELLATGERAKAWYDALHP